MKNVMINYKILICNFSEDIKLKPTQELLDILGGINKWHLIYKWIF